MLRNLPSSQRTENITRDQEEEEEILRSWVFAMNILRYVFLIFLLRFRRGDRGGGGLAADMAVVAMKVDTAKAVLVEVMVVEEVVVMVVEGIVHMVVVVILDMVEVVVEVVETGGIS
ncbi:hypothetical protein L195_g031572 [Trifolium pratense]|uniref:Uncharacterized protein n=1 Tax=Trifolium pratense TaxID=57577 RepID=A0A2K3LAT4_TRIPR|nr:hypothetical protein L195_g031572 [Trifolium pratense]